MQQYCQMTEMWGQVVQSCKGLCNRNWESRSCWFLWLNPAAKHPGLEKVPHQDRTCLISGFWHPDTGCGWFSKLTGETYSEEPSGNLPLPWEWVVLQDTPRPTHTSCSSLKAPLPMLAASGLSQGANSLWQLQTGDPSTLTTLEKQRNRKGVEPEGHGLCVTSWCSCAWCGKHRGCTDTASRQGHHHHPPPSGSKLPSPWLRKWIYWISRAWVCG